MFALLLLSYGCLVTVNALWLCLTVPWIGLQYVIVVFPDHTHLFLHSHQRLRSEWASVHVNIHTEKSWFTLSY